ncbi:hypothetical protein EDWATA_02734 [Edwardsiella tarda ATCC 23685]|uniref:Uncharacterized protein n=1 Tax=Edwardsiella tarda ATCC 23685 TaxID=500638 RepID=D4F7J8_EDWTA|nr:hypothetical protein EDWATA_02734 [Edwardsiella tarda ATCC 23685]
MVIPSPECRQRFLLTLINKIVNSMFVNKILFILYLGCAAFWRRLHGRCATVCIFVGARLPLAGDPVSEV